MTVRLVIRTPTGVLFDGPVGSIRAEDTSGWFGIRPGREGVVAALPAGLLLFRDEQGEGFVAHLGGLLSLDADDCRVTTREAVLSRALDDVAQRLEELQAQRGRRRVVHRDVLTQLAREALRRMVREVRR